jgi:D-glycero-beta-D-manno-heptose-7-phosphate kinase
VDRILSKFSGVRLLVVGDVMLDEHLWGTVGRLSPEAPVPVVEVLQRSHVPGGAANAAANAAGLGAKVMLAGVIGGDESGKRLCGTLTARGIDISGLFVDSRRPTTTKTRILAHNQQMLRLDHEQRLPLPREIEESLCRFIEDRLAEVDACILSDYAKGVVSPALARRLIQRGRALGTPVVVDPKGCDAGKYRGASLVKPNLNEAALLLNRAIDSPEDIHEAGWRLVELLGSPVLLTRGAAGMSLFPRGGEVVHIPAVAREVCDVTGAGDTVAATLAVALASGASLEQAALLASRAAAVIVGRVGTSAVRVEDLIDDSSGPDSPARGYPVFEQVIA